MNGSSIRNDILRHHVTGCGVDEFDIPEFVNVIYNAINVIPVSLLLRHIPANVFSVTQRDAKNFGDLRGVGFSQNQFRDIVSFIFDAIRINFVTLAVVVFLFVNNARSY